MSEASAIALAKAEEEKLASHVQIEWTGIGAKHIATPKGNSFMIPKAVTPIPREVWELARPWIEAAGLIITHKSQANQEQLDQGRIIEHGIKVETVTIPAKKGPGGKILEEGSSTAKITEALALQDMPDSEARALIEKTFDPVLLKEYLESPELDAFPGLKGAIERQLTAVEKGGKKKGSK
jgi:hypothetical protein